LNETLEISILGLVKIQNASLRTSDQLLSVKEISREGRLFPSEVGPLKVAAFISEKFLRCTCPLRW